MSVRLSPDFQTMRLSRSCDFQAPTRRIRRRPTRNREKSRTLDPAGRFVMLPRHELTTCGLTWCPCIIIVMKHKEKPLIRELPRAKTGRNAETISSTSANAHGNGAESSLQAVFYIKMRKVSSKH